MHEKKAPASSESELSTRRTADSSCPSATPGQQKRRQKLVLQYISILFAAAFVLLLFTFIMEKRQNALLQQQNQEQIDNLQESVSAVQSLQDLYDENAALKAQVNQLEDQISALESQHNQLEATAQQQADALTRTTQALDWFWQIDEAYARGKYAQCRNLISKFEDAALTDALPTISSTDNGRFSPYDRYQEIYRHVF